MTTISPPKDNSWSYEFTCRKCEAVLYATTEDIQSDSTDPRDPTWFYVICPHCRTKTTVKPPRKLAIG